MEPLELRQWLDRNEKTYKYLVAKFGISASWVFAWMNGDRAIPRWLPYALKGLECELS
jgi:hypothetical protein